MQANHVFKTAARLMSACAVTTLLGMASLPAAAQLAETRYLFANSHCKYPIRMLVHHKDSQNDYHPHGWYEFTPFQESRLRSTNDVVLRQMVGASLYVYAETTGESAPRLVWGGKDAQAEFGGVHYNLRRFPLVVNSRGELEFSFRCDA